MSNSELVIYRCTECDETSTSLGELHAHAEKHRGLFGIQWPWQVGDFDALMDYTEILQVDDYSVVGLQDVEVR